MAWKNVGFPGVVSLLITGSGAQLIVFNINLKRFGKQLKTSQHHGGSSEKHGQIGSFPKEMGLNS